MCSLQQSIIGAKRICAHPDISHDDRNSNANNEVLNRERTIKNTGLIMKRSLNVESGSSKCPSEGSSSWYQTEFNTTVEADSTIACLSDACQGDQETIERTVEVIDLDELIKQQQESICRRRQITGTAPRASSQMGRRANNHRNEGRAVRSPVRVQTLDEKRKYYLRTLRKNVFDSREALQNRDETAIRGRPLFSGLRVDEENNMDMQRVYRLTFESKIRLGQPHGTYDQFRSATGSTCEHICRFILI